MPMNHLFDTAIFVCAGFVAVIPLLFFNVRFAKALGLIDWPKARGLAEDHVPIVGPSLILVGLLTHGILMRFFPVSPWLVTSTVIIAIMGYFDDRRPLGAVDKLFFQFVCAGAVVYLDPSLAASLSDRYGAWGLGLGTLFIVTLMNAINFVDGIDGLAGMILLFAFGAIPFLGPTPASHPYGVLACVLLGSLIPFLYLNVSRRRGFLGNVGSYVLSFLVAVAHLQVPIEAGGAFSRLAVAGLCFLVPLADFFTVVSVRLFSGRSPFRADKGHLHHRLVQTNLPLPHVLGVLALVQGLGTATALYLSRSSVVQDAQLAAVVFVGYAAITATLILLLERASRIRVQAYFLRLDAGDPIYFLKYRVEQRSEGGAQASRLASMAELHRLEAKFSAEIRVTDICVARPGGELFIVLRTLPEPLKGISARLESVIQSEPGYSFHVIERGDFAKRLAPLGTHIQRQSA